MERDGLSREEAERQLSILSNDVLSAAEEGQFFEAEDIMLDYGFEPDYIADLLI